MKRKYKVGDIVRDKNTGQVGVVCFDYIDKASNFDIEVVSIGKPFEFGGVYQDCFKHTELELYDWKPFPKTFLEKLRWLFTK